MSPNYYELIAMVRAAEAEAHALAARAALLDPNHDATERKAQSQHFEDMAVSYRQIAQRYRTMAADWRKSSGDAPVEACPF